MARVRIASISVNRSDWGRMLPLYESLHRTAGCELSLYVHGGPHEGSVGVDITPSGVAEHLRPVDTAAAILAGVGEFLAEKSPDYLVILGDRFEMLAAAHAAILRSVPIIHIGGGYLTFGAFDEQVRHAITKLSMLHLAASEDCVARIVQMGEAPGSVFNVGAPDIDAVKQADVLPRDEFFAAVELDPARDFLLVTLHPETHLDPADQRKAYDAFFGALTRSRMQILMTAPCPDPGAELIIEWIGKMSDSGAPISYVPHLGQQRYVSAMNYARAMVGNSSSGLIEAPAIPLAVVNAGDRQGGRKSAANVLSVGYDGEMLDAAICQVLSEGFRARLADVVSPYGDGRAIKRIETILLGLPQSPPTHKRFHHLTGV